MSSKRKSRVNSNSSLPVSSQSSGYSVEKASEDREKVMKQKEPEKSQVQLSVYSNPRFMHVVTALTGNTARVHTRDGEIYEGIFSTFSPNFDVALSAAHKVDKTSGRESKVLIETFSEDAIVFKSKDVVEFLMKDVDLDYAVKDTFATDSAISAARLNGGDSLERELEPWVGDGNDLTDLSLESANGWDADEMFKRNEVIYGVTSTFKQNLDGYTVALNVRDSAEFKEMEARAARLEREIISSSPYDASIELDSIDEEEKYSAVTRPGDQRSGGRSASPQSNASSGSVGKYIHPNKRKGAAGKPNRPSQHTIPPRHQATFQSQQSFEKIDSDRDRGDREPQPQRYPPRGRVSPSQPVSSHSMQQRNGPPPGHQERVTSPKSNAPQHAPSQAQPCGPPNQQQVKTQAPPQQLSPAGYYKQAPTGSYTAATLRGPPEPVHVNGDTKMTPRPPGPAPSPQVAPIQGTPATQSGIRVPGKQIQQKPREDQIADLKKFGQDFRLTEGPAQSSIQASPAVHPTHLPPPNMVPLPQMSGNNEPAAPSQPSPATQIASVPSGVASPSPSADESDKSLSDDKDVDGLSSSMKKSNLNPNAKEFVFNPNVKAFTPRSPGAPTPPRSITPQQAAMSVLPGQLSGQGMPYQSMPVVLGTPYYPSASGPGGHTAMPMHSPVVPQQPYGPAPNSVRAFRPRAGAVQVASSQVASVTGQPLLAPGPLPSHPFTVQYTPQGTAIMTPQGALMSSSQHFPQFSQMPLYPIRLMTSQGGVMSLVATSGSYGDSSHSAPGPVYMTTVPSPAHTPGGNGGQGPNLYQPPTPSPALVNPPPQGTPTGAPPHPQQHSVMYTPQPSSLTPGGGPPPHTPGPPPGAPHHAAAFPMVLIPPGHQGGLTHMLPFQQGPNGITMGMIPQFHYMQVPVSSGQQQQHQHMVQQHQ